MVLYLLTKLHYKSLNQYSISQKIWLRLLTELKKKLYKIPLKRERFWWVSRFAPLSQKNEFVFLDQIWHYKPLNQYSMSRNIQFQLLIQFKANLWETPLEGESCWVVPRFTLHSKKNSFVFVDQIWHYKALN